MSAAETLPMQALSRYLDAGADLSTIPDLENYARFFKNRNLIPDEDREALIDFFLHNFATWERGGTVTIEGEAVEPSEARMRHALWISEGLHDETVAERFLAALPDDLREATR